MKRFVLLAMLLCTTKLGATDLAAAQETGALAAKRIEARHVPQRRQFQAPSAPIVIPQQFSPPQEAYASFPEAPEAAAAMAPSACQLRLAKIAVFQPLPVLSGPGECGAADAVLLQSVAVSDQAKVTIAPPATLRCTMAEEVAHWLREDAAPAALKLGGALRALEGIGSYECRGRNRVRGATLSEHGRANALDVSAFRLANGQLIGLTDVNVAKEWREGVRASACARFSTVLGPGSDGNHEEHIHLDLAERHGGYKMCEWDVRGPPAQPEKAEPPPAATAMVTAEPVPLPRPRPTTGAADEVPLQSKKMRSQLR